VESAATPPSYTFPRYEDEDYYNVPTPPSVAEAVSEELKSMVREAKRRRRNRENIQGAETGVIDLTKIVPPSE